MTLQELSIIFFFGFLVFVGIVAYFSSKQKASGVSADVEYYLGGHSTPTVVLAFSYVTSSISAACFMGDPGIMSTVGWPYYWVVIAIVPGLNHSSRIAYAKNETASRKTWFIDYS